MNDTTLLVWLLLASMVGVFIAGLNRSVVIYYDEDDLGISFGVTFMWVVAIGLFLAGNIESSYGETAYIICMVLSLISLVTALIFFYLNFRNAIRHNRSVGIGLLVGLFKIPFAWMGFVALLGFTTEVFSKDRDFRERIVAASCGLAMLWLLAALINGPEVHEEKGWDQ